MLILLVFGCYIIVIPVEARITVRAASRLMLKPPAAPSSERRPSPATGERLRLHGGPGAPVRPQRGGLPHLGTRPLLRPHRSGAEQDPARERGAGSGAVRAGEASAARQGGNVWIRDIQGEYAALSAGANSIE